MAFVRILFVSVLAAIAGCAVSSIILFGELARISFAPLVFTLMGSVFLLAPAYGAARQAGQSLARRYLRLLLVGAVGGAIMLAIMSLGTSPGEGALYGVVYGVITATCWIVAHFATRKIGRDRR